MSVFFNIKISTENNKTVLCRLRDASASSDNSNSTFLSLDYFLFPASFFFLAIYIIDCKL